MLQFTLQLLVVFVVTSSRVNASPDDYKQKTPVLSLCPNVSDSILQSGVDYGAAAYSYRHTDTAAIEFTSTQALLLSLLNSLVTGNMTTFSILAECSHHIQQLHSRHLRLWLREDFRFHDKDIEGAMAQLNKLVTTGLLNLPDHVLTMLFSVTDINGITPQSEKYSNDLALELENAVSENSPCDIIALATKGGNVNGSTQSGDSLVHLAVRTRSRSSIAALGFLKADLEVLNAARDTPMGEAIKNKDVQSIKQLVLAGAKVEKRFIGGYSYLHRAVAAGKNEELEALLEAGIDPNIMTDAGETSLLVALTRGNAQGMKILLDRGANASLLQEEQMRIGWSALHLATLYSYVGVVKVLLDYGANLTAKTNWGMTPLMTASHYGKLNVVKLLIDRGAPLEDTDYWEMTPLHRAVLGGDLGIVTVLLDHGANLKAMCSNNRTALILASQKGKMDIVKLLVNRGAPLNDRDGDGRTAVGNAWMYVRGDIENYLRSKGGIY